MNKNEADNPTEKFMRGLSKLFTKEDIHMANKNTRRRSTLFIREMQPQYNILHIVIMAKY